MHDPRPVGPLAEKLLRRREGTMQTSLSVVGLMSSPLIAVSPGTRVDEVLGLAHAKRIHHFPIVAEDRLVGFVCTCDLLSADGQDLVASRAWPHPVTVSPACPATDAARLMLLHGVGSLVVADHRGLHGILTCEDLRRASSELETLLEDARCVICRAGQHLRPGPGGVPVCAHCKRQTPGLLGGSS